MKKLYIMMISLIVVSCSSEKMAVNKDTSPDSNLALHQERCVKQKIGLDCAKYAYLIKATNPAASYDYYKKGCVLKDSSSCYNIDQMERSASQANLLFIDNKSELLLSCYSANAVEFRESNYVRDRLGIDPAKETKNIAINVFLRTNGQVKKITVDNYNVSAITIDCMKKALSSIQFLKSKDEQHLGYTLVVPKSYLYK